VCLLGQNRPCVDATDVAAATQVVHMYSMPASGICARRFVGDEMTTSTPEIETETLAATIHEFQIANPSLQTCALVYGVAYPQMYSELLRWLGHDTASQRLPLIFDAHSEDSRDQYGPYLVRFAPVASKPSSLLMKLARCCVDDFRGISFLFSSLLVDDLVAGLRERLDVKREDRSEWQMKFFDTRSLAVLDSALSVEQRRAYFGVVKEWWYLDRCGDRRKIIGESATTDSYSGPLRLDEKQATAFEDAGVPDSVLYSLSVTDGKLFATFDARTRYKICAEEIAKASADELNDAVLVANRVRRALIDVLE